MMFNIVLGLIALILLLFLLAIGRVMWLINKAIIVMEKEMEKDA